MKATQLSTTVIAIALAMAGCKSTSSQLEEDLYFPNNGATPESVGYLTWVVGDQPAAGQPDNRHICRAPCAKDPSEKARELGIEKLNDVRQSCASDLALSIAFTKFDDQKSPYYGAVSLADSAKDILRNGVGNDAKVLAGLMRLWQERSTKYSNSGVSTLNTTGELATPLNQERADLVEALFSNDNLLYLPEAVEQARSLHDQQHAQRVAAGIIPSSLKDDFPIPVGTPRYSAACFSGSLAGDTTKAKDDDKSPDTNPQAEAKAIGEGATKIDNQLVYDLITTKTAQCVNAKPIAEYTIPFKEGTMMVEYRRYESYMRVRQISGTDKDLSIMFIKPGENYTVHLTADQYQTTITSKAFHDISRIWGYLYTLNNFTVYPSVCGAPDAEGWITLKANVPTGRTTPVKALEVGKVRYKAADVGGWIEFQDPAVPLEQQ